MRALRAYVRADADGAPDPLLSKLHDRPAYDGLREPLGQRADLAELTRHPALHDFRRAFALNMLRNGVDVFALQKLLGHSDVQIMRRYLAQNNTDTQAAHMRLSPVDNGL